jgi:exosome complex RNA-binding protein Csl4
MAIPILVTGDGITFPVILKKNKATFNIATTATIVARLVSSDRESAYTVEVAQVTNHADADLSNSLIIISFATDTTIDMTHQGTALVEIQVDDGRKLTWFTAVQIKHGQIA